MAKASWGICTSSLSLGEINMTYSSCLKIKARTCIVVDWAGSIKLVKLTCFDVSIHILAMRSHCLIRHVAEASYYRTMRVQLVTRPLISLGGISSELTFLCNIFKHRMLSESLHQISKLPFDKPQDELAKRHL